MEYPNLDIIVRALLAQGRKVEAVKQVRQATLWGLRESKDYVDALALGLEDATGVAVAVDYTAFPDVGLLAALEYAGRGPHPSLIRECLARRESLTPGLLALLGGGADMDWPEEDPRWYREIHAGLLLCALREPDALPIFARLLREEENRNLCEWFDFALPHYYGSLAIPMLIDILDISDVWPSISACEMLVYIALHHPEERERVIAVLTSHLPPLDDRGKPVLTAAQRRDPPLLWPWIASGFMDMRHGEEHTRIKALFDADVMDESVFGEWEDYIAAFEPDAPPELAAEYDYDIIDNYERLYAEEQRASRRAVKHSASVSLNLPPGKFFSDRTSVFVPTAPKVGRNDPCPCGSGKKYKHCCGKRG